MYVVPLVLLLVVAIVAMVWAPIFAAVIFVLGFGVFLAYVGLRPRADQQGPAADAEIAAQPPNAPRAAERGGVWGEKGPDA